MQRTWKPVAGGILSIISGVVSVVVAVSAVLFAYAPTGQMGISRLLLNVGIIGIPLLVIGILAIAGGISALRRRRWGLALTGSICAVISPGILLGIPAVVLVAISRGEFDHAPAVD